jgi:hypothetical protein
MNKNLNQNIKIVLVDFVKQEGIKIAKGTTLSAKSVFNM